MEQAQGAREGGGSAGAGPDQGQSQGQGKGAGGLLVVVAGAAGTHPALLQELESVATALAARLGGTGVAAWFDQGRPALPTVLEEQAGAGHRDVLVVPYLLQWGFPAQFSLPAQVLAFARAHPQLTVRLAAPVGATAAVSDAIAQEAHVALGGPPVTAMDDASLTAFTKHGDMPQRVPTAPVIPTPAAHLLLCQGRWCLDAGATELESALREDLRERGLERGKGRVQLTRTRCVGPCGAAPLIVHYPANDWYWGLRPDQAGDLVATVTGSGEPGADPLAAQRARPQ